MTRFRAQKRDKFIIGVVDDRKSDASVAAGYVKALGHQPKVASAGRDVLSVLKQSSDGLVLDARLDDFGLSSVAIARTYRNLHKRAPIMLMSDFFASGQYDNIERKVAPAVSISIVRKPELSEELMAEWISGELEKSTECAATA